MEILEQQYKLVKGARAALFTYLETIPIKQLQQPLATYNHSSICYLLAHIAATYINWLDNFGLAKQVELPSEQILTNFGDVKVLYQSVDETVANFLSQFKNEKEVIESYKDSWGKKLYLSVLQLFTHVTTHEFHHKGQILNMTRQLGFVPVDTDIIRT